jgi:hypothetical protein
MLQTTTAPYSAVTDQQGKQLTLPSSIIIPSVLSLGIHLTQHLTILIVKIVKWQHTNMSIIIKDGMHTVH